jgi:hypothetical protein
MFTVQQFGRGLWSRKKCCEKSVLREVHQL